MRIPGIPLPEKSQKECNLILVIGISAIIHQQLFAMLQGLARFVYKYLNLATRFQVI